MIFSGAPYLATDERARDNKQPFVCRVWYTIVYYERASAASGASSFVFKGKI